MGFYSDQNLNYYIVILETELFFNTSGLVLNTKTHLIGCASLM